jgi:hypothetical protein
MARDDLGRWVAGTSGNAGGGPSRPTAYEPGWLSCRHQPWIG